MLKSDKGIVKLDDSVDEDAMRSRSIDLYVLSNPPNEDDKNISVPVDGMKGFRSFKIGRRSLFRSDVVGDLAPINRRL